MRRDSTHSHLSRSFLYSTSSANRGDKISSSPRFSQMISLPNSQRRIRIAVVRSRRRFFISAIGDSTHRRSDGSSTVKRKEKKSPVQTPIRFLLAFVLDTCRSSPPFGVRDSGWNVVTRVPVLPAGRKRKSEETRCDVEWVECLGCTQLSLLFGHLTPPDGTSFPEKN